jgi:hypothetical protein
MCNVHDRSKLDGLNFRKMADSWTPIHFEFYVGEKGGQRPDITYILPSLAFRARLKSRLFPFESDELEFLPIVAAGDDWLIVNCLRATNCYDEAKSLLHRDQTGEIFMVQKLIVTAPLPKGSELFTIDGSNRAYTYLVESLVDRIKDLGLNGLTFKEIGRIAK